MNTVGDAKTNITASLNENSATTVILTTEPKKTDITATSQDAGTGTSFSIIPPFTVINYIIKF
jgi:hypothetical protein